MPDRGGAALDPARRRRDLARMGAEQFDVVVVGGGVTGCGAALDAVTRGLMLERLAPHLVQPVPFVLPLTHRVWQRAYYGAGVALYDVLAGALVAVPNQRGNGLPAHRHLSRRGALRTFPGLRPDRLVGAIRYWDAQVDDARHTVTVARTAARYGAALASSARVVDLLREGGRVRGVRVRDL